MRVSERLARASVLIVGAGGLGSPAALALAASGVGRIGLVDDDSVDLSNLARQILHRTADLGRSKVESGAERLGAFSDRVRVKTHRFRLEAGGAASLVEGYDAVVDGSDNLPTKFLVNDACVLAGRPLVAGAILRFFGQLLTVLPGESACYRCLFGGVPPEGSAPTCQEAGVMGAVAGFIGMLQAGEAVRILAGRAPAWAGRLFTADLWSGSFGDVRVARDPGCAVCGESPAITSLSPEAYRYPGEGARRDEAEAALS